MSGRRWRLLTFGVAGAVLALVIYLGLREDAGVAPDSGPAGTVAADAAATAATVARGRYLVTAGNCIACHTARGATPFAGGRAIATPFGAIYSSNLTPDPDTGLGKWSAQDFWRALHHGKSRDGTLLYPAFPFPSYTRVTRADADAMYAYLRTLAPVRQAPAAPALAFPFNQRWLLVVWRALYFRPGVYRPLPARGAEWNRGAYLVQGLGHCSVCHAARNALGAARSASVLNGAMTPLQDWYAPALNTADESGLAHWSAQQVADLLKTGVSARGVASGPMAEVVGQSLQYLSDQDIAAMTAYLRTLPQGSAPAAGAPAAHQSAPAPDSALQPAFKRGKVLYERHCVDCHGAAGAGKPPNYPPLAGNRGILLRQTVNPIRAVLHGGYPPSTQGNPRPYGMPPFGNLLSDAEVADLLSYIRNAWGNRAGLVSAAEVNRYRAVSLD